MRLGCVVTLRSLAGATLPAALLLWAHRAAALPGLTLEWAAPAECPSATTVEARITELLLPSTARPRDVTARAQLEQQGELFHLRLAVTGPGLEATRELAAPSCSELAEAGALLIALAIDPEIPIPAPPSAPEPAAEPPPVQVTPEPPAKSLPPPPPPAPKPKKRAVERRWWVAVGLDAAIHDDGLPGPSLGVGARGSLGYEGFAVTLGVTEQLERSVTWARVPNAPANDPRPGAVDLKTRRFGADVCHLWSLGLRIGPCLGVEAIWSSGAARGVERATTSALWWGQARLALLLQIPVWEVFMLTGDAGAGAALSPRPRFEVGDVGVVAEGRTVSMYGRVGVAARFGL